MLSSSYIGIVSIFGGSFAPVNWMFCNGELLSIAEYTALYSVIGNTFGGDGVTTFGLPDLRGRVAIHAGQGQGLYPYAFGASGGQESIVMTNEQLPPHTHSFTTLTGSPGASSVAGVSPNPYNNVPAAITNINCFNTAGTAKLAPTSDVFETAAAGGVMPVNTLSPYLAMNYVICIDGIYPPRD